MTTKCPWLLVLTGSLALMLPGAAKAMSDDVQIIAAQEVASSPLGTIRATSLRGRWLAYPGLALGGRWYLRPGAELAYGRLEQGNRDQSFWQLVGLGQVEYRTDTVGFYLQGGIGGISLQGNSEDSGSLHNDTLSTHLEVGFRLREGARIDLGFRRQTYRDSGLTFQGVVLGVGY